MRLPRRIRSSSPALTAFVLSLAAGCTPGGPARAGYSFSMPAGWEPVKDTSALALTVPGELVEAFRVPPQGAPAGKGASFILFRTGYAPRSGAEDQVVAMRYLLLNLPSLTLRFEGKVDVAGLPAARVEATADGNGESLAPTTLGRKPEPGPGAPPLEPTRRVWIKIPRGPEHGTLEVFFHCREVEYESLKSELNKALGVLQIER